MLFANDEAGRNKLRRLIHEYYSERSRVFVLFTESDDVEWGWHAFVSLEGVTTTDIQNSASYSGKSVGVTVGMGDKDKNPAGNFNPQGSSIGTGSTSGSAQSVSKAAISGIAGDKAARTGNAEAGLKPIFDRSQVLNEITAQVAITGAALSQGASAWGGYANKKYADAVKNGDTDAQACWGPAGGCRASGHALIGALGGGVAGGIAAGTTSTLAPRMQEFLVQQGLPPQVAAAAVSAAATSAGGALGGSAGAGGAFNEAANNFVPALLIAMPAAIVGSGSAMGCMSTPACVRVLQLAGTAAVDYVAGSLTLEQLSKIPGILSVVGPALRVSLEATMGSPIPPLVPGTPPVGGNTGNQNLAPNYGYGTAKPGDAVSGIGTPASPAAPPGQTTGNHGGYGAAGAPIFNPLTLAVSPESRALIIQGLTDGMGAFPQFEKDGKAEISRYPSGTWGDANRVFDSMPLKDVKIVQVTPDGEIRRGLLPDGTAVIVRPRSTDSTPTIEVQDLNRPSGKPRTIQKIRFGS